jgi:uncharacterized membrane protein YeiH
VISHDLSADIFSALNNTGMFAFALSGALMGVRRHFDIVGMAVLATVTALGGGIVRDVLINIRPTALHTTAWLLIPLIATVITFFFHHQIERIGRAVDALDAVGLGLFCATATALALTYGISPVAAVFLGAITGIGGGLLRDVLAGVTPSVFSPSSRLYAVPAVLGSIAIVLIHHVGPVTGAAQAVVAAAICVVRLLALWRGWTAPVPRRHGSGLSR